MHERRRDRDADQHRHGLGTGWRTSTPSAGSCRRARRRRSRRSSPAIAVSTLDSSVVHREEGPDGLRPGACLQHHVEGLARPADRARPTGHHQPACRSTDGRATPLRRRGYRSAASMRSSVLSNARICFSSSACGDRRLGRRAGRRCERRRPGPSPSAAGRRSRWSLGVGLAFDELAADQLARGDRDLGRADAERVSRADVATRPRRCCGGGGPAAVTGPPARRPRPCRDPARDASRNKASPIGFGQFRRVRHPAPLGHRAHRGRARCSQQRFFASAVPGSTDS